MMTQAEATASDEVDTPRRLNVDLRGSQTVQGVYKPTYLVAGGENLRRNANTASAAQAFSDDRKKAEVPFERLLQALRIIDGCLARQAKRADAGPRFFVGAAKQFNVGHTLDFVRPQAAQVP